MYSRMQQIVHFFILISMWSISVHAIDTNFRLKFKQISVNDGLSQNSVTSFIQDKNGILMIGTYDGINFFNGYEIEPVRYSYDNPKGLFNNRIVCMSSSHSGKIWMGLDGGVALYDSNLKTYTNYTDSLGRLRSFWVRTIYEDLDKDLWVGTTKDLIRGIKDKDGHYQFTAVSNFQSCVTYAIKYYKDGQIWVGTSNGLFIFRKEGQNMMSCKEVEYFSGHSVYAILFDREDNIWIGYDNGIATLYNDTEEFTPLHLPGSDYTTVHCLLQDKEQHIWVGTAGKGLYSLETKNKKISNFTRYTASDAIGKLADDNIENLYIDASNVLWIGTRNGVNYADLSLPRIYTFGPSNPSNPNSKTQYHSGHINSLFIDKKEQLWISVYGDGLYLYNLKTNQFSNISSQLTKTAIARMIETKQRVLWIAAQEAVYRVEAKGTKYHKEAIDLGPTTAEAYKYFQFYTDLCEDAYGDIWITTVQELLRYNPTTKQYISYLKTDGIASDSPFCLLSDTINKTIWVGAADQGLTKISYDRKDILSTEILRKSGTTFTLSHDQVWCIYKSSNGTIWIGTDGGLNRIKLENNLIVSSTRVKAPHIKDAKIEAITEDSQGNLWLNSSQGLYCYNPTKETVKRYTNDDGLQSNACTGAAATIRGWIFIGGIKGLNFFNPCFFKENTYVGHPIFTQLKIFNTVIKPREKYWGKELLTEGLNNTTEINLGYKLNNFILEFTSDHYAATSKNSFKYLLLGYDRNWIEVNSSRRYASYENLPPGKYTFRLMCSNKDGVWSNHIRELSFNIAPPFWLTWWAYILYVLITIILLYSIFLYLRSRQRWRYKFLLQEIEKKKDNEINEMKLNFYTNITHELRTPLALISAPLDDLRKRYMTDEYFSYRANLINKNVNKLLQLINQLLDIRKVSINEMPLTVTQQDTYSFVKQIVDSFYNLSIQNKIYFRFTPPKSNFEGWFDCNQIEKVINNLISNAFKFTPQEGSIEVKLWKEENGEEEYAILSVSDSGIGISAKELPKIFDMFYHGTPLSGQSSGVGLSFSKALAELHGGNISVESSHASGSIFTVKFRIDKDFYKKEYIIEEKVNVIPTTSPENNECSQSTEQINKKYVILIIEDHDDMRKYLTESLQETFDILTATDGEDGLFTARKYKPDLVITDMMMPRMSGIDLIHQMKADHRTNHIPIIVYSAKSDKASIREAFRTGAQEYIVKPFDMEFLTLSIRNQLKSKEQFLYKVKHENIIAPSDVYMPSPEEELLQKIHIIMERNMSNTSFGVEQLADELKMSRSQLYRKIQSLPIGKNAVEIIRGIRIQRAAQLLSTGQLRITEVMFEVGITNNARFSSYFRDIYGLSPKEYLQKNSPANKSIIREIQ